MRSYCFGDFILDVEERRLLREGEVVRLTPKVFDTLAYLVEHHGHLAGKDELMEAVWNDSFVEEGNLPRTIHILRRALGEHDNDAKYIETVPTKGYRFVAEVKFLDGSVEPTPETSTIVQPLLPKAERHELPSRRRMALVAAGSLLVLALVALTGSGWRNGTPGFQRFLPQTTSGAAYMKYQAGRLYMERQYGGDYQLALMNFDTATKLDPDFAAAYAGKADAEIFLFWDSGSHDDIAKARLAVSRALELDPSNSYAHTVLCRIRATYDWDFAGAEKECRRAVELDPANHEARRELAFVLNSVGRPDDALKEMETAIALAPTSFNKRSRGLLLYYDRRFDEAIAQLVQVEATDPEYSESNRWIARCFEQKKDYGQALEFLIRYRQSAGAGSVEVASLLNAFSNDGWPGVLRVSLQKNPAIPTLETAGTFAQLGETDKAFEILDRMIRDRRVMIVHMESDPRLDPLRSDPRFEQLAKRVGLR
ncbi:MAG: winged helix-turn-helix domain-containing protein [Terriglobia bacterium]|nr:winged helix-turn-helix domain-containing protein [Terriglobia bacterium]